MGQAPSVIVYDGPSQLDPRTPILGIVTRRSRNSKTGPMDQLWILVKWQHPVEALRDGTDQAVCGVCPIHDWCYVVVAQAPRAVWDAYTRGQIGWGMPGGRAIRLGAYGDPAALPPAVLAQVVAGYQRWTGYTHQWRTHPELKVWCMASVHTPAERAEAEALGWRTFRTGTAPGEGEIWCPAPRTQCVRCNLCDGTRGPDDRRAAILIAPHGARASTGSARSPALAET